MQQSSSTTSCNSIAPKLPTPRRDVTNISIRFLVNPPQIPPSEEEIWYWEHYETNAYIPYEHSLNVAIIEAFLSRRKAFEFTIGDTPYAIFFDAMLQFNTKKNTFRIVTCTSVWYNKIPQILKISKMVPNTNAPNYRLIPLDREQEEMIGQYLKVSIPTASILQIQYIENRFLEKAWEFEKSQITEKNGEAFTKMLFHGTRGTNPHQICNTPQGLCVQHSNIGMWGRGIYFSDNARYCDVFAYHMEDAKQLLLCEVILGDGKFTLPCKMIRLPPPKQKNPLNFAQPRYDSVWGISRAAKIYVVYDSSKTIPRCLVTYKS